MECLPGSKQPDDLRAMGYDVSVAGDGERILPAAVIEKCVAATGGALEPLKSGSPRLVAQIVTHVGFVKVRRYSFDML